MNVRQHFLRLAYPFYTRLSAIWDVARELPDPVLIYQMSKVGSSTVYKSLKKEGVGSVHVHFIAREHWRRVAEMYSNNNTTLPSHFHKGRLLRYWINATQRQVRVVSLVRDPIARHVSGAFEIGNVQGIPTNKSSEALRVLEDQLSALDEFEYPFQWFAREIEPTFGVDVLSHPFNRKEGFGRITTDNVDILILRTEQLSTLVPTVLGDFVGEDLDVQRDRVRTNQVYTTVKHQLCLSEPTVRRLYDHPWMHHFYTDQDIERFVERWTESQADGG